MRNPLCRPSVAVALLLTLVSSASAAVTAVRISSERRQSFDDGWRFFKGDAPGAEKPDFDDSKWRQLSLPHDWAIEGPFDSKANPHTGALPISGTGWYRKSFTVPDAAKDRYLSIMFDGAQNNAHVFLNGEEIGSRPYGYISFSVDLTGHLKFGGQTNVLAVRLTPEDRSSRWYPGAGIYRNVWLDVTGPVHVGHWGTYITTPGGERGKGYRDRQNGYPEPDEQRSPHDRANRDSGSRRKACDAQSGLPPMCPPEALKP